MNKPLLIIFLDPPLDKTVNQSPLIKRTFPLQLRSTHDRTHTSTASAQRCKPCGKRPAPRVSPQDFPSCPSGTLLLTAPAPIVNGNNAKATASSVGRLGLLRFPVVVDFPFGRSYRLSAPPHLHAGLFNGELGRRNQPKRSPSMTCSDVLQLQCIHHQLRASSIKIGSED